MDHLGSRRATILQRHQLLDKATPEYARRLPMPAFVTRPKQNASGLPARESRHVSVSRPEVA